MDSAFVGPVAARADGAASGDAALLASVAKGDDRAFAELYDRYSPLAYAIAFRICGEAAIAEEVVADAFVSVWRGARTYEPGRGDVAPWLSAIVRNRALDERRRRRRPSVALKGTEVPVVAPADGVDARVDVRTGLAALATEERLVLELAYFEGLTQKEIAARTGSTLARVRTLTRRALEALAESLR